MSELPVIHCTPEELYEDRFWFEHLEPITRANGLKPPTEMEKDAGDEGAHLLKAPDGRLLAVVRTDRPPCPTCNR